MTQFVHLRLHSSYSLSQGAVHPKAAVGLAAKHKMPAVAVTDTNNLFGALEFSTAAMSKGIQPIIGAQLQLFLEKDTYASILLIVQNEAGYKNLLKMVSDAYMDETLEEISVTSEILAAHNEGLLLLTSGDIGPLGHYLKQGKKDQAEQILLTLNKSFENRLYVEIMRHHLAVQDKIEEDMVDLAYKHNLPLVATNDVYFESADMHPAHDVLMCISQGTTILDENRKRLTAHHYFKDQFQMAELFKDLPEALQNTVNIAKRCHYFPDKHKPMLPDFETEEGRTQSEELTFWSEEGLKERLDKEDVAEEKRGEYYERLKYELGIIEQMGFPGYFLIVSDFIQWAKKKNIPVGPGRGSGAGSVVAWALKITDLDPLRWGLLFERFLNPERVSMPDFDIDFCQDRRDEVIRYVQKKYGRDHVAQIITFGKLQARAALRDVGRVLGMPYGQVDRICKLVPNNPANPMSLGEAIKTEPELREESKADASVKRLLDIALKLEGLYRHASTHAAGVVIGDRPLHEIVPLYRDPRSDMPITQFNMKFAEAAGLVKFDFLGLKTLTILQTACELVGSVRGVEVDLADVPLDNKKTYEMLSRGETTGVFQLESSGMRDVVKKLEPDRFEEIIALVALYRPGPMDNIPLFISVKKGEEEADYLHPSLEPILKETFGIMVYQEQVMQIAQTLAGYSLGGADLLRRAMGKKIKEEMDAQRKIFVKGSVENGVDEKKADYIFGQVDKFAGYGFNKSHAAAYALIAYHTAYLKANYPVAFLAACMTYDMGNTEKLALFKQELERLEIDLLPPDVNASQVIFSVEEHEGKMAVRYALSALKNVGEQAMESMIAEREANGPFKNIDDFAKRIDPKALNKRQIEYLVAAGGFDSIYPNRAELYKNIDKLIQYAQKFHEEKTSSQVSMFGGEKLQQDTVEFPKTKEWPLMDKLSMEFDAVGFYLSAHPLSVYRETLEKLEVVSVSEVAEKIKSIKGHVKLAGIVSSKKERISARGSKFAFVTLSDESATYEVTLFSETLAASREYLEPGQAVYLTVDGRAEEDNLRLTAHTIEPLDRVALKRVRGFNVHVGEKIDLEELKQAISSQDNGKRGVVRVVTSVMGKQVEIKLKETYPLSERLRQDMLEIPEVETITDYFG